MGLRVVIFTDLDGTLLDPETYDLGPAAPLLSHLQDHQIPVIPTTSKTRAEVEALRERTGLKGPFIVENGSAAFFPLEEEPLSALTEGVIVGPYRMIQLGCTYEIARQGLKQLAEDLGYPLRGFGDMDLTEIQDLTGLSHAEAVRARAREFSEPFLTPPERFHSLLHSAAKQRGFRVVQGDRFSHLIGLRAGKGAVVQEVLRLYRKTFPKDQILAIGLGNSPNDREMLEQVEIAIVIPGPQGPHPALQKTGWQVAPAPGPKGWAEALRTVLIDLKLSTPSG